VREERCGIGTYDDYLNLHLCQGHWIQDCPTNNDREFDNRPRIKRTTGIPRSMLKAVENPTGDIGQGVMVTPEGGYVVAQPDLCVFPPHIRRRLIFDSFHQALLGRNRYLSVQKV
jgi:hypothetical protein